MGDQGILQVVKSSSLVYPDEAKSKQTEIGSQEAFQKLLKESHEDVCHLGQRRPRIGMV